jgi:hypothetical protein
MNIEDTKLGEPFGNLTNQKIRRAYGGYIVTIRTHSEDSKHPIMVYETIHAELEDALAELIEHVADGEDGRRVLGKLFADKEQP